MQWWALVVIVATLGGLFQDVILPASTFFSKKGNQKNIVSSDIIPIFKKADTINFNVLITRFEDYISEEETKCIGRSLQESIEIINSNPKQFGKIIVKYADSVLNPKTILEAAAIRKEHNADLLIYGLVTITDNHCNFKNFRFRYNLKDSYSAKLSPTLNINSTKHDADKSEITHPSQIIEGRFEINGVSMDNWISAMADLKFNNPGNAFLNLDSRLQKSNLNITEKTKLFREIGESYLSERHFERSIITFDEALKLNPKDTIAYHKKGVNLRKQKKYEEAINEYNSALSLDSSYAPGYYGRGITYYYQKNYSLAIRDFHKAIEIDSQAVDYPIYLGYVYSKIGKHREAMKYHDKAVAMEPENYETYLYRAIAHKNEKNEDKAITDFSKSISLDSSNSSIYNSRGILYKNLEQFEESLSDYQKAIDLAKNEHTYAFYNRGYLRILMKNYKLAIRDFDKSIQLDPDDIDGYYFRGRAQFYLGRYKSAINDFNKCIFMNDTLHDSYYQRGKSYYKLNKLGEAIADFDKAIEIDSLNSLAFYKRANAYGKMKNKEKALQDYSKVIELNPKLANTYNSRGVLNLKDRKVDEALSDFRKTLSIDSSFYYSRINIFFSYCIKYWYLLVTFVVTSIAFWKRRKVKSSIT